MTHATPGDGDLAALTREVRAAGVGVPTAGILEDGVSVGTAATICEGRLLGEGRRHGVGTVANRGRRRRGDRRGGADLDAGASAAVRGSFPSIRRRRRWSCCGVWDWGAARRGESEGAAMMVRGGS